jgi:XXXCH domain-containing protein
MTFEKKIKITGSSTRLAEFLKQLAAQIDGTITENTDGLGYRVDNFTSISLIIKRHRNGYSAKLKVKSERSEVSDSDKKSSSIDNLGLPEDGISFKRLKKRMKSSSKSINKDIMAGNFPNRAIVESFVEDTDRMARFPDKCGDPYFEFKKACNGLIDALDNADFDTVRDRYAELKKLRNDCHRRKS